MTDEFAKDNLLSFADRIIWNAAIEEAIDTLIASQQFTAANTLETLKLDIPLVVGR